MGSNEIPAGRASPPSSVLPQHHACAGTLWCPQCNYKWPHPKPSWWPAHSDECLGTSHTKNSPVSVKLNEFAIKCGETNSRPFRNIHKPLSMLSIPTKMWVKASNAGSLADSGEEREACKLQRWRGSGPAGSEKHMHTHLEDPPGVWGNGRAPLSRAQVSGYHLSPMNTLGHLLSKPQKTDFHIELWRHPSPEAFRSALAFCSHHYHLCPISRSRHLPKTTLDLQNANVFKSK